MVAFGEAPIRVLKGTDDFDNVIYTLSNRDTKVAEAVGIPAAFEENRLEVMTARCLAHGYKLTIIETPTQKEEIV